MKATPDGDYGGRTKAAVSAFQKANGLVATGIADEATIKLINRLAAENNKK